MLGSVDRAANGKRADERRGMDRLARVLSVYAPLSESAATETSNVVHDENAKGHGAEDCESHLAETPGTGVGVLSTAQPEALNLDPIEQPVLNRHDLEEGAKRIAEALTWTLKQAAEEARDRAEKDRMRMEAATNVVERLSDDVRQVRSELARVRVEAESVAQRDSAIHAALAVLEDRSRQGETELDRTKDQVLELLRFQSESSEQARHLASKLSSLDAQVTGFNQVVEGLDKTLRSYGQAAGELSALCEKLAQAQVSLKDQLAEQALAIQQLEADTSHQGSVMDTLLGSLRGIEGRTERRHRIERDVKVVMVGQVEAAISGRTVDASDNGLGLRLAAALPVGSQVRLDVGGASLVGEVTHCRRRGDWYHAGLKSVRQAEAGASEGD